MIKVYNEGVRSKTIKGDLQYICNYITSMGILKNAETVNECIGTPIVRIDPNTNTHKKEYKSVYYTSNSKVDFSNPKSLYDNICLLFNNSKGRLGIKTI